MKGAVRYPTILETATFPDGTVRKTLSYVYAAGTLTIGTTNIETFSQMNNTHAEHRKLILHNLREPIRGIVGFLWR